MPKEATGKSQGDGSDRETAKSDSACRLDESEGVERPTAAATSSDTVTSPFDRHGLSLVAPPALDALRHLASATSAASEDATARADEESNANALAGTQPKDTFADARGVGLLDAANDRHAAPIDAGRAAA